MRKNILVTGANGQLGKTLKDLCSASNDQHYFTFASKTELDISSKEDVSKFFSDNKFDYCINCAAYTNVEQAEESTDETFKINADAVEYLAQSCKRSGCTLIHISTDYVFDGSKKLPYLETDSTNPINAYGHSKLEGERRIIASMKNYFIIRTSWLYSKYPKNFLTTIASKILDNSDLTITTSQTGTPTSCEALSRFIYWLITSNSDNYGIYHYSAKGDGTWYDFAMKIAENFSDYDYNKISPTDSFKSKAERPSYSVMDNSKVQKLYPHQDFWYNELKIVLQEFK